MGTPKQFEVAVRKRKEKLEREHKLIDGVDHKFCNKHPINFPDEDIWFPATFDFFYKNSKNATDGLYPYCKRCGVKNAKKWNTANPQKYKQSNEKWELDPRRIEYHKVHSKTQKKSGYYSEYIKRDEVKARQYSSRHSDHKINATEWVSCKDYFKDNDGDWSCAYCGKKIQDHFRMFAGELQSIDFHREHLDPDGANDLSNCIPSCGDCNSSKWTFEFEDWYGKQIFFTQIRYSKIIQWIIKDYNEYIREVIIK